MFWVYFLSQTNRSWHLFASFFRRQQMEKDEWDFLIRRFFQCRENLFHFFTTIISVTDQIGSRQRDLFINLVTIRHITVQWVSNSWLLRPIKLLCHKLNLPHVKCSLFRYVLLIFEYSFSFYRFDGDELKILEVQTPVIFRGELLHEP